MQFYNDTFNETIIKKKSGTNGCSLYSYSDVCIVGVRVSFVKLPKRVNLHK